MKNEPSRPLESRQKAVLLMAALVLLLLPTAAGVSACQRNAGVSQTQALPAQAPSADIAGEVNRPGGNVTTPKLIRELPRTDRAANSAACLEHVLKAGPSCLTALTIGTVPT